MHASPARRRFVVSTTIACLLVASVAGATVITMNFGSLPSTQGWTFGTGGSPTATEAGTFSVASNVLTLDTMAFGTTGAGTSAYYIQNGVVSTSQPLTITVRARVLQWEGNGNQFQANGFCFGFAQGSTEWLMGITPTRIYNATGTVLSGAYDNTQFHDYRIEWTPPSTVAYYVDNTLISTNNTGFGLAQNWIIIGDGTGAGNARAEITSYSFLQGEVVPVKSVTWGGIKALYR